MKRLPVFIHQVQTIIYLAKLSRMDSAYDNLANGACSIALKVKNINITESN